MVARWTAHGPVGLLTCTDLSTSGWRYSPGVAGSSIAVVGGQKIPVESITGVLTRLPCVFEQELVSIIPADRSYVASEMTAFLLAWLSELRCPVLNRPTPVCLSGPYWRQERWITAAARLGIPVQPVHQHAQMQADIPSEATEPSSATVTVVGKHCFGTTDETLADQARCLATAAQVDLLAVQFSGPQRGACLLGAHTWPDLNAEGVEDAVLAYLQGECPGGRQ